jgi:hypothetical protein
VEGVVNRAISICSGSRAALLPLNPMPCLPEMYYSAEILFRSWLCLTELDWCGSLDTVISMEMGRPTHLQERDQVLLLGSRSLVFRWHLRVSSQGRGSGYLNHTAPHGAGRLLVVSQDCAAEKAQSKLNEILTDAA